MRDKLIWKLLGAYIPLILLAIVVLNFFVSIKLRKLVEDKISEQLYHSSLLIGSILQEDIALKKKEKIRDQIYNISKKLDSRITVIDKNGTVYGDSEYDPKQMENHSDRPEVIRALENGRGESIRLSDTLKFNMKYVAVPYLINNEIAGVIRLAIPLNDLESQIRVIYRAVLIGGICAAIMVFIVGFFISKSITNPIREMEKIAQSISRGDFSKKINLKTKDELGSLAKSFNRMADNLQAQIDNLKKMDKVRTDFVANVSHELKTPLTSIKGYIETLQDGALDDKENAERFLTIIKKHADSLTNIVNDLLILSEAEAGNETLNKTTFDIKSFIDEIILGFGHDLNEKNINAEFESRNDTIEIYADKGKIEQVIVNVIDNAIKYTENGRKIKINLSKERDIIFISIQDNGIGISEKHLSRVFERFYRVDKARSRKVGGTGLGLAIVKHIVFLHEGEIEVESSVGQGTKINIKLPAV